MQLPAGGGSREWDGECQGHTGVCCVSCAATTTPSTPESTGFSHDSTWLQPNPGWLQQAHLKPIFLQVHLLTSNKVKSEGFHQSLLGFQFLLPFPSYSRSKVTATPSGATL